MSYKLCKLPLDESFNTVEVLQKLLSVNDALSDLDKEILLLPNYQLILKPLTMREAVASSEIENIRTTTLEMLEAELLNTKLLPPNQKEVISYRNALLVGYETLLNNGNLELSDIINIHCNIVPDKVRLRTKRGVYVGNALGDIVYTPPQDPKEIEDFMNNLLEFINSDYDPILKIIVTHYQFEAIHPFRDGNGRAGRILMALMFCLEKKLKYPILFVSGYILRNKQSYYQLFRDIQDNGNWNNWIRYHLNGIEQQAVETMERILEIQAIRTILLDSITLLLKPKTPNSTKQIPNFVQSLDKYFFSRAFYTQTNLSKELCISRITAKKYLELFKANNLLDSRKAGKELLYFIPKFVEVLG